MLVLRAFLVLVITIVIVVASGDAHATTPHERVVIADRDPELRRAMLETLRPWEIDVLPDDAVPADVDEARTRADGQGARFVVWRERDQLLIYDRMLDRIEFRATTDGALDPLAAAAAALTVKTAMRLPVGVRASVPPGVQPIEGAALRFELGVAVDQAPRARYGGSLLVRPWRDRGLLTGLSAELVTAARVETTGFTGTFARLSALAVADWSIDLGRLELGPYLAAGITQGSLDGAELTIQRHAKRLLPTVRGGGAIRVKLDRWLFGAGIGVEGVFGSRAYLATATMTTIYEAPAFAIVGNASVGIDFP